jgi:hypothetical protein
VLELAREPRVSTVRTTGRLFFPRKLDRISSPEIVTCRFVSVVMPYVRDARACRSVPTRNQAWLTSVTAIAQAHSRS